MVHYGHLNHYIIFQTAYDRIYVISESTKPNAFSTNEDLSQLYKNVM